MSKAAPLRIAIIGGGPIGLEAALYARRCGFAVRLYERGEVGQYLQEWGHVRMFTPWAWNVTPLGRQEIQAEHPRYAWPADDALLTGREFRECYLLPLAATAALREVVMPHTAVVQVGFRNSGHGPHGGEFRVLLQTAAGEERLEAADVVLDCSGTYGSPRWLGDGEVPAVGERAARPLIPHGVVDILGTHREWFAGRSVAVVGDGLSAATNVVALAELARSHPETWVFWLTRGPRGQPLSRIPNDPLRERDRLAARANALATRGDGHVEFHPQTFIDTIIAHGPEGGFHIAGRSQGRPAVWEVDRLIAAVGYRSVPLLAASAAEVRGYFVLGAKASPAGFLLRDGHEQIRQLFARLCRQPRLDLYGPLARAAA